MKPQVVVINNDKVVFSGTHIECANFINKNKRLYYNSLYMRCILNDGNLGPKLRSFLWER